MRNFLTITAAFLALVLVAGGYAATASDRIGLNKLSGGIEPAEARAGDEMRYQVSWTKDADGAATVETVELLVTSEGPGTAVDRFGIARPVHTYLVDVVEDGEPVLSVRCAALAGSGDLVRLDVIAGEQMARGFASQENYLDLVVSSSSQVLFQTASTFRGDCPGLDLVSGRAHREGDVLPREQAGGAPFRVSALADGSAPAVRTEFQGRAALSYAFASTAADAPEGAGVTYLFADGLPGAVRVTYDGVGSLWGYGLAASSDDAPVTVELVGFAPGAGAPLGGFTGARLPDATPDGLVPFRPLVLDDAPFQLSYPFAEAFAAVSSDPGLCVGEFLAMNPDAYLREATFDADERDPVLFNQPTEGGWSFEFRAGEKTCEVLTVRLAYPVPGLPGPRPVRNYPEDPFAEGVGFDHGLPRELPTTIASGAHVAKLLMGEGQAPAPTGYLSYFVYDTGGETRIALGIGTLPAFGPRESGTHEGRFADLELVKGGLSHVMTGEATRENGLALDSDFAYGFPARGGAPFASLGGPEFGQGLAVGLLAGAALLLVLAKSVALPFYTRLKRDALLENPVRARLYEQVRREPGVHQAALVNFAGIGKGATARHLERLVKARYLAEIHEDGYARYYAVGEVPPAMARRAAILRSDSLRAVYELYCAEPRLPLREAARRLGVSAPSVHRAKRKLEEAGLLPAAEAVVVVSA